MSDETPRQAAKRQHLPYFKLELDRRILGRGKHVAEGPVTLKQADKLYAFLCAWLAHPESGGNLAGDAP